MMEKKESDNKKFIIFRKTMKKIINQKIFLRKLEVIQMIAKNCKKLDLIAKYISTLEMGISLIKTLKFSVLISVYFYESYAECLEKR